jgi:hypothetical protein
MIYETVESLKHLLLNNQILFLFIPLFTSLILRNVSTKKKI